MSLDWNLSEIENHEELCWKIAEVDSPMRGITKGDKILSPLTEGLIFTTMAVGMGRLDAEGLDEFFARVSLYERVYGSFMNKVEEDGQWGERPFTLDDLKAHIGLRTNVTYEPRSEWLERILQRHFPRTEPNHKLYFVEFIYNEGIGHELDVAAGSKVAAIAKARKELEDEGVHDLDETTAYVDGEEVKA